MKHFLTVILFFVSGVIFANDTISSDSTLRDVQVISFYRKSVNPGSTVTFDDFVKKNNGQELSHFFKGVPSLFTYNDNGTDYGYGYIRLRGLDQTRINATLDGVPWNEAEDFGIYFSNNPDIASSLHSASVEHGTSSTSNGVAGLGGGIILESVDLYKDTISYLYAGGGTPGAYKVTRVYNMGDRNGWGFHIKLNTQYTDGYRDHSFNRSHNVTLKTGYRFNNYHKIDFLTMNGYHRNGQGYLGVTDEELAVNPRANGCSPEETDNWFQSMNRIQYTGWIREDLAITSSLYLQYQDGSYRIDYNHFGADMLMDMGLTHYMYGGNFVAKYYKKKFNATLGTNIYGYQRRHFTADGCKNVTLDDYYDNTGKKQELSVFATAQYYILKNLAISCNIQQRTIMFSYKDALDNTKSFNFEKYNTNWNFINYGFSIDYSIINPLKVYARYNNVWREPTRTTMFYGNEWAPDSALATTTPELCRDLEVGTEFKFNRVTGGVNFFYMWFKDEFILTGALGTNGLPEHINADKSYRWGFECNVNWNIWDALYWNTSATYSKNKATISNVQQNHVMSPSVILNTDLVWKKSNYTVGINYNFRSKVYVDMYTNKEIIKNEWVELTPGKDINHVYDDHQNILPELWTLNIYGSYRYKFIEVGLKLNNITNRQNISQGSRKYDYNYDKNGNISSINNISVLKIQTSRFNFNINTKFYF